MPVPGVRTYLPSDLVARATALVPLLAERRDLVNYGRVSRVAVLRLALVRGLAALEGELTAPPEPSR